MGVILVGIVFHLFRDSLILCLFYFRDAPEATGEEPDDADFDAPKIYEPVSQVLQIFKRCSRFIPNCKSFLDSLKLIFFSLDLVLNQSWLLPCLPCNCKNPYPYRIKSQIILKTGFITDHSNRECIYLFDHELSSSVKNI